MSSAGSREDWALLHGGVTLQHTSSVFRFHPPSALSSRLPRWFWLVPLVIHSFPLAVASDPV